MIAPQEKLAQLALGLEGVHGETANDGGREPSHRFNADQSTFMGRVSLSGFYLRKRECPKQTSTGEHPMSLSLGVLDWQ
jgi:hypothetical protein